MILVTGATGFIGGVLIRHLSANGKQVRTLIRPSKQSPRLPRGVPIEVAVCGLKDERGLRAAMKGVDTVYHLAGIESRGSRGDLMDVDILGTQAVAQAASEAGVDRIFFLSHLGADRASAFPVLKAKAIAENYIRQSKIDFTIFRSAVVYGVNDHFTTGLGILVHAFPGIFIMPGDGSALIQPIWVEDLATCMTWALDDPATRNQVYNVGGPEYISIRQALTEVMTATGGQRWIANMGPAYLRSLTVFMEQLFPSFPASTFWLDYLAANRTCDLDSVPRSFGLMPAKFAQTIDYLRSQPWQKNVWNMLLRRYAS